MNSKFRTDRQTDRQRQLFWFQPNTFWNKIPSRIVDKIMKNQNSNLLEKLVASIRDRKFDPNVVINISCFYEDKLLIWNEDNQRLYACSFNEQYNISEVQIVNLSCSPSFYVTWLSISPSGNCLALYGFGGVMVAELPRNLGLRNHNHSSGNNGEDHHPSNNAILIRSFSLSERMFLCNRTLKLLCLRWHPLSKQHLIILTNDNCLRLFNLDDEYEPIKTINLWRTCSSPSNHHSTSHSIYSESLGENSVSFDFGPSLTRYQSNSLNASELIGIYPIYILKENGDILLVYLDLENLSSMNQVHGPLKMTPAAEDNYGSEACSILCLDSVPPIVVIGTKTGVLYHCLAIENDQEDDFDDQFNDVHLVEKPQTKFLIPEIVLYVLENIQLSFPLASYQEKENAMNDLEINASLILINDLKDSKRYFCIHSFGVHVVFVSFFKQLMDQSTIEFHDEKSICDYYICTRPTIDKDQSNSTFPIGVALTINNGFTFVTVLLSSGELISKRLPNIAFALNTDTDHSYKLSPIKQQNDSKATIPLNDQEKLFKKPSFSELISKILAKNNSLPLIKSAKPRNAVVGLAELEMVLNSIDVLRKEYLEKFSLAAKAMEKKKLHLKDDIEFQLNEIENLKNAKDLMLKQYADLLQKYYRANDASNELLQRLERAISVIMNQSPTLSKAEIKLKDELTKELKNLESYKEKLEQIKQKRRYQDAQIRKNFQQKLDSPTITSTNLETHTQFQLQNIQQILAAQGEQIKELVSLLNSLKNFPLSKPIF